MFTHKTTATLRRHHAVIRH
jgi:hypothetical protein